MSSSSRPCTSAPREIAPQSAALRQTAAGVARNRNLSSDWRMRAAGARIGGEPPRQGGPFKTAAYPDRGLPGVVAKKAEPGLLRDHNHWGGNAGFRDLAFVLRFRLRLRWFGRLELRKCLQPARLSRDFGDRCRCRDSSLCLRDQCGSDRRNDRRHIGIEHNALGPFPVGADPDDRFVGARLRHPLRNRNCGRTSFDRNNSASRTPPTRRKYRATGISDSLPSARARGPHP